LFLIQLKALSWEYYFLGEDLSAEFPGAYMRSRAVHMFCALMDPKQV
jgi:hypothetical protein